jgi:nitroimidazol reductase NimA-like FMN-containing flavoprotein (pyridoxamine 5'-phosphate oxidase superfamily)
MTEHRETRVLSRNESLRLLASEVIGRVVLTANALPTALPVHYGVDGDAVVFRTGPGIKLNTASRGTVVAFEADHFDEELRMGWSVVVVGVAHVVTDPDGVARAEAVLTEWWAEPAHPRIVRIEIGSITGRWLVPVPAGMAPATPEPGEPADADGGQ